jgi:hypothetical protein
MLKKFCLLLFASLVLMFVAFASAPFAQKVAGAAHDISGQNGARTYAASLAR